MKYSVLNTFAGALFGDNLRSLANLIHFSYEGWWDEGENLEYIQCNTITPWEYNTSILF